MELHGRREVVCDCAFKERERERERERILSLRNVLSRLYAVGLAKLGQFLTDRTMKANNDSSSVCSLYTQLTAGAFPRTVANLFALLVGQQTHTCEVRQCYNSHSVRLRQRKQRTLSTER